MGYSPQKTPFDLTDFLSKPGSPKSRKWKRKRLRLKRRKRPQRADTAFRVRLRAAMICRASC